MACLFEGESYIGRFQETSSGVAYRLSFGNTANRGVSGWGLLHFYLHEKFGAENSFACRIVAPLSDVLPVPVICLSIHLHDR